MDKISALAFVEANLKQDVEEASRQWEGEALEARIAHWQNLRGEVGRHYDLLLCLVWTCELAQTGTVPRGFLEWSGGRPFGYYETLLEALEALPRGGQLSPALLTYLEELPARRQRAQDEMMHILRNDPDLQRIWFELPSVKQLEKTQARHALDQFARHLEGTVFAQSYADDLARAHELAAQRGDWTAIRACLA